LRGNTRIIGNLEFNREDLIGFFHPLENDDHEVPLIKTKAALIIMHDFARSRLISRSSIENSSDKISDIGMTSAAFRSTQILEWPSQKGKTGFGMDVKYHRKLSVTPLFLWKNRFAGKWEADLFLPSHAYVAYYPSPDRKIFAGLKGSRATYYIHGNPVDEQLSSTFRRLSVHAIAGWERQLTSLVGISLELGASIPLQSGLYGFDGRWKLQHDFGERVSPYARLGVFLAWEN
jgi:hypothetical protein